MKAVKVLIPILLVIMLTSAVSPVLARERLTFDFDAVGEINHSHQQGVGANMFLSLEGRLTLGTPDEDSGWSDPMVEDQWHHQQEAENWWQFTGPNGPDFFPGEQDVQYEVHYQMWRDEHWQDEFISRELWFTPRGSFSGELVALWDGGTASETYKVSLSSWRVRKTERDGSMQLILADSARVERYDIWTEGWSDTWEFPQSVDPQEFSYWSENFMIENNGKFQCKKTKLGGYLRIYYNTFQVNSEPEIHYNINGNGEFGLYQFGFGGGGGNGNG